MPNHKSAKKRSRQTLKRNRINNQVFTKIRTNLNNFNDLLLEKNKAELDKSLSLTNSSLAKALKKGLLKKEFVSRKLSSLSQKIKNI
ncbi:30S ribosomal protein S20 [Alphaproteobacteria bacterium]|nr:30S ribosomal protein S20 [Alphaproteobacteria bacterium]